MNQEDLKTLLITVLQTKLALNRAEVQAQEASESLQALIVEIEQRQRDGAALNVHQVRP